LPLEGGDMSGGIGWTVRSVTSEPPLPHVQPSIPPEGEPYTVPSAPPPETGEECKQSDMPFHGRMAPFYPEIRMYKPLEAIFLILYNVNKSGACFPNVFFVVLHFTFGLMFSC
jgi:hypothetical protein